MTPASQASVKLVLEGRRLGFATVTQKKKKITLSVQTSQCWHCWMGAGIKLWTGLTKTCTSLGRSRLTPMILRSNLFVSCVPRDTFFLGTFSIFVSIADLLKFYRIVLLALVDLRI